MGAGRPLAPIRPWGVVGTLLLLRTDEQGPVRGSGQPGLGMLSLCMVGGPLEGRALSGSLTFQRLYAESHPAQSRPQ